MNLEELNSIDNGQVIFRCISGSRAYGTATPQSDTDIRGVYVLPKSVYVTVTPPEQQVSDERNDITYYSLKRFVELAANANPNIIELLYMPDDCVMYCSAEMDVLLQNRDSFISKQCYESHVGYAQAQIKRARGRNKWVNNPQPEDPPKKESFCWFVPLQADGGMPLRPIAISDSSMNLSACHCSSLEHCADVYRLYDYGAKARGVFRNGHLVCESIPKEDESKCIGLLIYNKTGYDRALKDHRHYWEWRKNRNDKRWQSQESGEMDYDAKNMMHTFRLLLSGKHILETGRPLVRFEGPDLDFLKKILNGGFNYDELIAMVEEQVATFETLKESSSIQDNVDQEKIDKLMIELTELWELQYNA